MFIDFGHILKKMPLASVERSRLLSCFQILIAVTLLVGVGVMYVSTVRSAHSAAASDLVVRGKIVSSIVARAAAQTLDRASAEDANAALERVIYDIRAEQGLEFAFIVDRGHRAIAHSETSQAGTILDVGLDTADKAEAHRGWTEDGFYYTARPANESTARAGTSGTLYEFVHPVRLGARAKERYLGDLELHLAFVLPPWSSFAKSSIKLIAPGLAIAFMLLIVGNYAAGVLVRPLGNLRRGTAAAAKELDNCVLEVNGRGDVVEIARNWNDMVGNFRTSHESTTEARRELEVRNRVMLYEKKRIESIVDSLPDGVIVTDAYGRITSVNRECENQLGISRDEVHGRTPDDAVHDDSIAAFMREHVLTAPGGGAAGALGSVPGARQSQKCVEHVEVQRQNGTCHIRIAHTPILDGNRKPCGGITTFRDSTQDKLEEAARKDFISSVTHELRAPLTAIKSYVEMLIDNEAGDPDVQRDFFNTINEEADRLARLIDDMLNMSKMEVGNLVLNKSLVRTRKLLEDAVHGVRSVSKAKSIELATTLPDDLPDVEADKEMVRVVVTNLLSNGIKYTQDGGNVFLTAEAVAPAESETGNGSIVITVTDNGPGIPEDEQAKVFETFYRAKSTAEQKVVGNGLGLALAREIATLHGGDIKLESTVGQGSKFSFTLPAAEVSRKIS